MTTMPARPELRLFVVLLILHVLCSAGCGKQQQKANARPIARIEAATLALEAPPPCLLHSSKCEHAQDRAGCERRYASVNRQKCQPTPVQVGP